MAFRACLNTSTIKPVPTVMEKIAIAAEAGFDAVELWNDDLTAHVEAGGSLGDVRQALDDAGLERPSLIHFPRWMDASEAEWAAKQEEAKSKMEQGAAIGAPYLVCGPAWADDYDPALAAARYVRLIEIGESIGCLPALEFLSIVPTLKTLPLLWDIAQRANHPKTKIVMDSFHIWNGGGSVADMDLVPAEQISIFHINDAPKGGIAGELNDPDRVMPGDGILPLREMLEKLRAKGWAGCLSLEIFNERYWAMDPLEAAREGRRKVQAVMDAV